ncbi:hypothetical protein ZIOFF_026305 [Zingiber officinale]|uniref:LOB domain-containing protein n=1 Tax=Zingiber officinale TaxID=94328 RepID=A0A8J5H3N3_ZINOF|nr:hypothetical protein ZIOFF_026305 [Zingiber officinale]
MTITIARRDTVAVIAQRDTIVTIVKRKEGSSVSYYTWTDGPQQSASPPQMLKTDAINDHYCLKGDDDSLHRLRHRRLLNSKMTGFGSPCGACKFLRRKCMRGCVFAPYFCHEQSAAHFAAIHKVFGASNASKLLMHLPVSDRSEAALTISYEAQARIQDPIYGCVAHIFALQQQVVTLEAQLASLKAQIAQGLASGYLLTSRSRLDDEKLNQKRPSYQPGQGFNLSGEERMMQPLISGAYAHQEGMLYFDNGVVNSNNFPSTQHYDQLSYMDSDQTSFTEDDSSSAMASLDIEANARRSSYLEMEDLQSVAFGHLHCA